eukprot:1137770-Pelagomonas_calceolata.AAC.9
MKAYRAAHNMQHKGIHTSCFGAWVFLRFSALAADLGLKKAAGARSSYVKPCKRSSHAVGGLLSDKPCDERSCGRLSAGPCDRGSAAVLLAVLFELHFKKAEGNHPWSILSSSSAQSKPTTFAVQNLDPGSKYTFRCVCATGCFGQGSLVNILHTSPHPHIFSSR